MAAAKGNQYAAKGGRWSAAISKRIEELQAMDKLAEALVLKALDGDMQALKEIGDRLDGKSRQQIDVGGQPDNPFISAITVKLVKSQERKAPDGD